MNEQSVKALAKTLTARPVTQNLSHGFDNDASYASILIKANGAKNIERIYQFWTLLQSKQPEIAGVEFDESALTATLFLNTRLSLEFFVFKFSHDIQTTTLLSFKHGGEHNKLVITKQVDISPVDKFLMSIPQLGTIWKSFILPFLSIILLQLMILVLALKNGSDISQEKDLKYNAQISQAINTAKPYVAQAQAKIDQVQPLINQAIETVEKVNNSARQTFDKANASTRQTLSKVNATAQETIDLVNSTAQPFVEKAKSTVQSAQATAQPYIDQAQAKASPYIENVQPIINRVEKILSNITDANSGANKTEKVSS